jgi:hypothetical protein
MIILGGALLFLAAIGLIFAGRDRTQEDLTILAALVAIGGIGWSAWNCIAFARALNRAKRLNGH